MDRPFATHVGAVGAGPVSRPAPMQIQQRQAQNIVASRTHLSPWMQHQMNPRDPYGTGTTQWSKSIAPISRISALKPKVTGAGVSENNTGLEWAGTLYKPSMGEQKRENNKKGFFNNPDKEVPRLPPSGEPPSRDNRKAHILGLKDKDQPQRADPYADQSKVLANCMRASDTGPKKFYVKTNDDTWSPRDAPVKEDLRHARLFQKEAIDFIANAAQSRETARVKRQDDRRREKRAVEIFDPWSHPAKGNPDHHKMSLEMAQQKFDKKVSKASWVGKNLDMGTDGAGGYFPKERYGNSYDAETHLRNAYKTTQNSGDAVMTYSRKEHLQENRKHGNQLRQQQIDNRQRASLKRENSLMAKQAEKGVASQLGVGGPKRTPSGNINAKMNSPMSKAGGPTKKDPELGRIQEQQMRENAYGKKVDKIPQRYDQFALYDPYEKAAIPRNAGGYIKGGTQSTKVGQLGETFMVAPNVIVEGATIANVMGTPGGGCPNVVGGSNKLVAMMGNEEFDVELKAQARGVSVWNQPGGGGPIRKPNGAINTKTLGRSEMDRNGITELKQNPDYHSRLAQVRDQQEAFLKRKTLNKTTTELEEKHFEAKKQSEKFLPTDSNPHHRGKAIPDRFIKPKKDLYGREKPPRDYEHAKAYETGIVEKTAREKKEKSDSVKADVKHLAVVSEWQGKGVGHPRRDEDGHTSGHYRKDMSIHPDVDLSDAMWSSPDVRARKEAYHTELSKTTAKHKKEKKQNEFRRDQDEKEHAKNENKFLNRPGAGAPLRLKDGKVKTRRGGPPGDVEYKMMVAQASLLD